MYKLICPVLSIVIVIRIGVFVLAHDYESGHEVDKWHIIDLFISTFQIIFRDCLSEGRSEEEGPELDGDEADDPYGDEKGATAAEHRAIALIFFVV